MRVVFDPIYINNNKMIINYSDLYTQNQSRLCFVNFICINKRLSKLFRLHAKNVVNFKNKRRKKFVAL